MVDQNVTDGDTTKASPGSEPGVRKFTLSCSRCRASKLKCDKKEPCLECVKRNVGHLCTKDERQPRAKRAKTDQNSSNNNAKMNASQNQEMEAEEAAQLLENFVDGMPDNDAYRSDILDTRSPSVAPDCLNMYWLDINDAQKQREKLALIRDIVDAVPDLGIIRLLYEVFVTRCQGPLGNIVHIPAFMQQAEVFCSCLSLPSPEARVMALSSTIPMDVLSCNLLALVLALAFHPSPFILGWFPTPLTLRIQELRASGLHSKIWRSLALRCLQGGVSLFCGSIAALQAAIMLLLDGQEGSLALDAILVTAISGAQKLGLHLLGEAKLEASASPTSFSANGSSMATEPPYVRVELGVRIWWALVIRDWSRGQALGYYSIRPSQFSTRMPLHINVDDLCPTTLRVDVDGHITERPRSEFTMLSYTVHALEIATFARESIDLRGPLRQGQRQEETNGGARMRNHLNQKYENFVAGLPSHFRLGSTIGLNATGPMAAIPVHRWMLHQQLWSLFLRLHRANLSSQDGRGSCQLLAQNIISSQAQIQARCVVCGSLSTSKTQLFNAATVLLVDSLLSSKTKNADRSSAQLSRLMTRDKVREAIELLRTQSDAESLSSPQDPLSAKFNVFAQRSILVLEALIKMDEDESGDSEDRNGANSMGNRLGGKSDSSAKKSLKDKIADILQRLQGHTTDVSTVTDQVGSNTFSTFDMSMPPPTTAAGSQDLDVLPVLSNDMNYNFWQFLDFPPPQTLPDNGFLSPIPDLQNLAGSMPLRPSSGMAQPFNNFSPPDVVDVYGSTDGTGVILTPPSSTESGPTKMRGGSESGMTPSSTDAYVKAKML